MQFGVFFVLRNPAKFASLRARALLILCATFAAPFPFKSCSQKRRTAHFRVRNSSDWTESRSMFREILRSQYARFATGNVPHFAHPCQKHPSTKTASFARGKAKSGLPKMAKCRRQPVTLAARKASTSAPSVERFPRDRTADIMRERTVGLKMSAMLHLNDSRAHCQDPDRALPLATRPSRSKQRHGSPHKPKDTSPRSGKESTIHYTPPPTPPPRITAFRSHRKAKQR